ncbi:PVC-type heme-binding CxxCH protein [Tundrisphaera lichenicola]|uniref:PVC-type heme-binding CxxCH protein n=1 Tax=Tundrisphaera lichenicola TaxID=2029860 RepID=UPI003EBB4D0D
MTTSDRTMTTGAQGGPHFPLGRDGSGSPPKPPTRPGRELPPWRRWARKGLLLGGAIGLGAFFPYQKNVPIVDTDAEAERRTFEVAEGFEVNLFAADPLLAKPIQMNFDAAGRLWVASSEVYPQIKPGQVANDKIVVLEDVDNDGKAEKTTVFADGLLIPTGVEPGDGGAYVANSTELLHLADLDGDGKADTRKVALSGFGTEDTHHILHTLRWGPDGMLYFNQSIYIHSHIETPWGVRRLGGGGIWQFRPESAWLDIFARGWVNPWGHHFDRWGQSFATDGAGGKGINYVLPGASYDTAVGATRILDGLNPGSPKYCGAEIVSGRHLPEDWQGNILTNDFRANNVRRFVLSDDGAGYASTNLPNLITTRYPAFRPIDIKMGPDGAIYIADWYNPIIQHGEVDFRDPRRDHTRGRIWRVTAKDRPLVEKPNLVGATDEQLLEFLRAPEDWTRHFAKRVLKERGPSALPALAAWVEKLDPADPEFEHLRLEGLWCYQTLNVVEPKLLDQVLNSPDPRARAAAVRVTQDWLAKLDDPFGRLAARVVDEHPRVRLEAVRTLGHAPESRAAEIALRALERPVDKFLDYALWLTMRDLEPFWMPTLREGRFDYGGDTRRLVFALEAVGSPTVVGPLVDALKAGKIAPGEEDRVRALIATLGGPPELGMILDLAVANDTPEARRGPLLEALAQAARQRKTTPSGDLARVGPLLGSAESATQAAAAKAVGLWKVEPLRGKLEGLARDPKTPEAARTAAIEGLASMGGDASRDALAALAAAPYPASTRLQAVAALASIDLKLAAERAVPALAEAGEVDPSATFEAFTNRQGGPAALTSALGGKTLPMAVAKAGSQIASIAGRPDSALIEALNRSGGSSTGPRNWTPAERTALLAEVARKGNPARGELVFRRAEAQCLKCHAVAGAGGRVGPGLESIGASAPVDYLLDSLVEPNKAVKEGYHSTVIATGDGRVLTGLKVRQTPTEVVLLDAEGREVAIPADAIDEQKPGGSLMPAGLTDALTRAELVDLVRFLSEMGKSGPYAVSPQARLVRRWQVLEPPVIAPKGVDPLDALATDPSMTWNPAYSKVSGELPTDALATVPFRISAARIGLARAEVEVSTPGKVRLSLAPLPGIVAAWLDGRRIETKPEVDLDLTAGRHTLTFAQAAEPGGQGLRVELKEVPGSPARAQAVVGR